MKEIKRCSWAGNDPVYIQYHDYEWGIPVHNDTKLFEMLILEGFQAGLSWITILKKRNSFRDAFESWDYNKVASFTESDIGRLAENKNIVRNRLKIISAVKNARAFIDVIDKFGSFDNYIWGFTGYTTIRPMIPPRNWSEVPTRSTISDKMSKDLKQRGFSFVGTVICYSFMQAVGMVDDHMEGCFKCKR
ncbi:DNA-3-methyladenine glycosylase I [Chitinispirillales bacterium ANBcel5]|uniref:DNA-3-methyladenine glycosylase I n=1 Tax=Cellulosispirillum alkaliphilum TaxID=3039283 RepID=UPI002A57B73E|nr:DNA-3-methyladenine glycosylase I [Chitinispirillales bacterium ANBcel5]